MKIFKWLIMLLLIFVTTVVVITVYLSPDDMIGCQKQPDDSQGCQKADAIVAVSGGDTSARTKKAIGLYQDGWADTIVFSGAAQDKTGPSNAKVMRDEAIAYGIPADKILIEENSNNTSENAARTERIIHQHGFESVILVTSSYHQRRANMEFTNQLPSVKVRNSPVRQDNQWSPFWWANPFGWYLSISELIKILIVSIKGAL